MAALALGGCSLVLDPDEYTSGLAETALRDGGSLDARAGCDDADEDGVCDPDDLCADSDDRMDADGDGRPDGCDCDTPALCHAMATCSEADGVALCECDHDYGGDGRRECEAVDCGDPDAPDHGTVEATDTLYTAEASYRCEDGYVLVGEPRRSCQIDATWSGETPRCEPVDCGELTAPERGSVDTAQGTSYGQVATYGCEDAYGLVGVSRRRCQVDGTWSDQAPRCELGDCPSLVSPTDGTAETASGTVVGAIATYRCDLGHALVGDETRSCQADHTWSGTEPSCEIHDCGPPEEVTGSSVTTPDGTIFGSTAHYECDLGRYLAGGDAVRSCTVEGWSGARAQCDLRDCGPPDADPEGFVATPDGTRYLATASYSCQDGYDLIGATTRSCLSDGAWSGTAPSCDLGDCGGLMAPEGVTITTTKGSSYGSVATYRCDLAGYELKGTPTRTCEVGAGWSGSAPSCVIHDCGGLSNPINGKVALDGGTTYGQTALYTCTTGYYRVSGNDTRMCGIGGWSGTAASCVIRDCGARSAPANGTRSLTGTTYGQTLTYSCNSGYAISGVAMQTCQADGMWSAPAATCSAVDECADGTHGCSPGGKGGKCVNGAGYGYDCTCDSGYVKSGTTFPSCDAAALLASDLAQHDFGNRERGTSSSPLQWVIRNDGAAPSADPTLSIVPSGNFTIVDGCTDPIPAFGSCTVTVRFAPVDYGPLSATLYLGGLELKVSGKSQARLTATRSGSAGRVVVPGLGIDCGTTCSALVDTGTTVTLQAVTQDGSNSMPGAWTAAGCKTGRRACSIDVDASVSVGLGFEPIEHNLVFVSSDFHPGNLGSPAAYDAVCNARASAVGINNASGNRFISVVSSSTNTFSSRLGAGVRGWQRLDGLPFGRTITELLSGVVLNPVQYDEFGQDDALDTRAWSGWIDVPGIIQTCNDWTSAASDQFAKMAQAESGLAEWYSSNSNRCDTPRRVMCLGNDMTSSLSVSTSTGRRIWLSPPFELGTGVSPDQHCNADRPSGVGTAAALLATTTRTAASVIDPSATYVRPDGQIVGTGAQLIALDITSGNWQLSNGTYATADDDVQTWAGAYTLDEFGTADSTCTNWTDRSDVYEGLVGFPATVYRSWWTNSGRAQCSLKTVRLHCVQQP